MEIEKKSKNSEKNTFFPRSTIASIDSERRTKKGVATNFSPSVPTNLGPTRRFYSPELMLSNMFMPMDRRAKNRWRRWFYDHDVVVGPVIDMLSEIPFSKGEINCADPYIKKVFEETVSATKLFSKLSFIEKEYLIVGEYILHFYFDENKGYWTHIIIHDPDYIDVVKTPLVGDDPKIYLIPDEALRLLTMNNDPYYIRARSRLPEYVLKSILRGRNILLNNERTVFVARITRPGQIRGTSIIDRLFRYLMYEDKLIEAQITIADNYIYPLRIFKLGSPEMGVPPKEHADALAELLLQAQFDPNFVLIYNYGLQYEEHGHDGKFIRLENELNRVNEMKLLALGVNKEFMLGQTTYASANVYLQMLLSRLSVARERHEDEWIYPKFFKNLSKLRGFYKRDKAELAHNVRIQRTGAELEERLIIPRIEWYKSLAGREDNNFLDYIKGLNEKGKVSDSTLLSKAGLNFKKELENIKNDNRLKLQIGVDDREEQKGSFAFFKTLRRKLGLLKEKPKEKENIIYTPNEEEIKKPIFQQENIPGNDINAVNYALWNKYIDVLKDIDLKNLFSKTLEFDSLTELERKNLLSNLYKKGRKVIYDRLLLGEFDKLQPFDELLLDDFYEFRTKEEYINKAVEAFHLGQIMSLRELGIDGARLNYVHKDSLYHQSRFKIGFLGDPKSKRVLYPNLEIIYFEPEIESFDSPYCTIKQRYVSAKTENGVDLIDLPVEYLSLFKKVKISKVHKIKFVKSFLNEKDYIKTKTAKYQKLDMDPLLISNLVRKDALQELSFLNKDILYVSTKVFKNNGDPISLVKNLLS